jgi:DNA-binding NtrC family response regulator
MGMFEAADGGTLFLDELPSLSPGLQSKVLKAVEDHTIRRLGGRNEIPVDVRIIAATNQNLKSLIATGRFREDLYHRLDLYRLVAPPLRERREDILQLAELLMSRIFRRHRLSRKAITAAGKQRLQNHPWPGNIRELSHTLERAIVFEEGRELTFDQLTAAAAPGDSDALGRQDWLNPAFAFPEEGFQLEEAINRLIRLALDQSGQNVSAAARLLGVSRDYLRYRLSDRKSET